MLTILSWNLLAPIFVRLPNAPHTLFPGVEDEDLNEEVRRERIVSLLKGHLNADVLLLQEVQMERGGNEEEPFCVPGWLKNGLGDDYAWHIPSGKHQTKKEWEKTLDHNTKVLGRPFVTHMACAIRVSTLRLLGTMCSSHGLSLALKTAQDDIFVVTNVHLQASPGADSATRTKQLASAVKSGEKLISRQSHGGQAVFIVGGDCNDSGLELELYTRVPTGPTWTDGHSSASVDNFYVRGCDTVVVKEFWHKEDGLLLPSKKIPSDHAPLVLCVTFKKK